MLSLKQALPFGREELDAMQAQVRAAAVTAGFSAETITYLIYAVEEIGANILVHSGATWLELRFESTGHEGVLRLLDDGEEFDPVDAAKLMDEPVISEHLAGHLGLWTLKRMPMQQSWRRIEGVNELSFKVTRP
jgi:anti-sigma regulatory factor (Ser/Thr protein kinase)